MRFGKTKILGLATAAIVHLVLAATAYSALIINVGNVTLNPGQAGQVRQFFVNASGDQVGGMEFDIEVGDGGAALGGHDTGPTITAIDLETGTIFGPSSNQENVVTDPLAWQSTDDLSSGTVAANADSLIASVTFDTAGITSPLTENLLLSGVAGSYNTHFVDGSLQPLATTVVNGTISVLPEPGTLGLLGIAALGLLSRRRLP